MWIAIFHKCLTKKTPAVRSRIIWTITNFCYMSPLYTMEMDLKYNNQYQWWTEEKTVRFNLISFTKMWHLQLFLDKWSLNVYMFFYKINENPLQWITAWSLEPMDIPILCISSLEFLHWSHNHASSQNYHQHRCR